MIISQIFPSGHTSSTEENSRWLQGNDEVASLLILQVIEEMATWDGLIKIAARVIGSGADGVGEDVIGDYLAIRNRATDEDPPIAGATGISAPGIYEVNVAGMEFRFEHSSITTGAVRIRAAIIHG